jgi:hypothetical protein
MLEDWRAERAEKQRVEDGRRQAEFDVRLSNAVLYGLGLLLVVGIVVFAIVTVAGWVFR